MLYLNDMESFVISNAKIIFNSFKFFAVSRLKRLTGDNLDSEKFKNEDEF